mmetsp:Transcript_18493/g.41867  ORF Transcript_18493/g.41867 Transcript_18493/m.41867 type:complete len:212 (-) Transcript_18493:157-792(-)
MGKYAKKTKLQKKSVAGRSSIKPPKQQKAKKGVKKHIKTQAKKGKAKKKLQKLGGSAEEPVTKPDAAGDASMETTDAGSATRHAADKLVSFLAKAKSESKALEATQKVLRSSPAPAAMGVALGHLAGRGLASCVKLLIENGAPLNMSDSTQEAGRSTPLQLAASRGHVNVVRFLVQAGADRTGALEASQDLAKLGAVFSDERKAIQAALNS